MSRVVGHSLRSEGAAFYDFVGGGTARRGSNSTSGKGFALCSCGARSPIFESANQRKAWHRSHKAEVAVRRAAQATGMSE